MRQKNKNMDLGKSVTDADIKKQLTPQHEDVKLKLMNKYNLSSEDAEKVLEKFKRKKINATYQEYTNKIESTPNTQYNHKNTSETNNNEVTSNEYTFKKQHHEQTPSREVNDILSDIIPQYSQNYAIELDHVDLTFEVSDEKVDTIKEKMMKLLQRNRNKKIKIHALKDVSFKIHKGEKIGIIGYNGAGKSTLLNVITGIYPPDKGTVKTQGHISPLLSLGAGFDYNYSGRKNIFLNGAVLGYDKKFLKSKEEEIIKFSELGKYIDIPIKNYSSGMLAKLGFSIATIVNPDILIIDEILGVGDVAFRKKSSDKIKSLMDKGTTVILVSHSIPQIREICDKAIWIEKGKVKEIGEVNKVCNNYLIDSEKASKLEKENIQFR